MLLTIAPKEYANDIGTTVGVIFATTAKDFVGIQKPFHGMIFKDIDYVSRDGPSAHHAKQLKDYLDANKDAEHIAFICGQGVSRSSAALLFAMRYLCKSSNEDIAAAYKALYNIAPNKLFLEYLDEFLEDKLLFIISTMPKGTKQKKNKRITLEVVNRNG